MGHARAGGLNRRLRRQRSIALLKSERATPKNVRGRPDVGGGLIEGVRFAHQYFTGWGTGLALCAPSHCERLSGITVGHPRPRRGNPLNP
jgi:hypothetical protein